jgi:hypothetical protein
MSEGRDRTMGPVLSRTSLVLPAMPPAQNDVARQQNALIVPAPGPFVDLARLAEEGRPAADVVTDVSRGIRGSSQRRNSAVVSGPPRRMLGLRPTREPWPAVPRTLSVRTMPEPIRSGCRKPSQANEHRRSRQARTPRHHHDHDKALCLTRGSDSSAPVIRGGCGGTSGTAGECRPQTPGLHEAPAELACIRPRRQRRRHRLDPPRPR